MIQELELENICHWMHEGNRNADYLPLSTKHWCKTCAPKSNQICIWAKLKGRTTFSSFNSADSKFRKADWVHTPQTQTSPMRVIWLLQQVINHHLKEFVQECSNPGVRMRYQKIDHIANLSLFTCHRPKLIAICICSPLSVIKVGRCSVPEHQLHIFALHGLDNKCLLQLRSELQYVPAIGAQRLSVSCSNNTSHQSITGSLTALALFELVSIS